MVAANPIRRRRGRAALAARSAWWTVGLSPSSARRSRTARSAIAMREQEDMIRNLVIELGELVDRPVFG